MLKFEHTYEYSKYSEMDLSETKVSRTGVVKANPSLSYSNGAVTNKLNIDSDFRKIPICVLVNH